VEISCGDTYLFTNLPDGTYFINAFLDFNDSGGPPDQDEPLAWYGAPDGIEVSNGEDIVDIDITIGSAWIETFIPLITH
jgi:hypothetical protein